MSILVTDISNFKQHEFLKREEQLGNDDLEYKRRYFAWPVKFKEILKYSRELLHGRRQKVICLEFMVHQRLTQDTDVCTEVQSGWIERS